MIHKLSLGLAATAVSLATLAPAIVSADGNQSLTVYFTRHAEKQTVTTDVAAQVGTSFTYTTNDEGEYVVTSGDHEKGTRRDDVCGLEKCAEELSDLGELRAELLAGYFAQRGITNEIDAVYATHKIRTQQTVTPTAILAGTDVVQLPATIDGVPATELNPESTTPSECATLDAIASAQAQGMDTILIAGHSGTLYDIMGAGTVKDGEVICAGLGLDTTDEDRFPKDSKGKVRDFGDIWKVVIKSNGKVNFKFRKNLQPLRLQTFGPTAN